LRKCINLLQQNSVDGKLINPKAEDSGVSDYKIEMVQLFKAGKAREARKLICAKATADEMGEILRWCYDNVELFGKDEDTMDQAVIILKQGLCDHTVCADAEINMSAVLIKLARLRQ
jgi:hypothetical protein